MGNVFFLPLGQFETHSFLSLFSLSHSQRLNEKFDEKINAGIDQLTDEKINADETKEDVVLEDVSDQVPEPPPNAPLPPSDA